jgi:hypothetical protein
MPLNPLSWWDAAVDGSWRVVGKRRGSERTFSTAQLTLTINVWLIGRAGQQLWTGTADIPPAVPWLTVRNGVPRVCPAGCVGGQAAQPGPTRTPSPSEQLGAVGWSPHCPARGRRSPRRHRHKGQTEKSRGNPEGQRYRPGKAASHVVAWGCKAADYRASRSRAV